MSVVISRGSRERFPKVVRPASKPRTPAAWLLPSDRILLAVQFWKGDRDQAMKLARLIADLEPSMCEKADFLFSSRFDCPQDTKTVEYVSSKFRTYTNKSRRRGVGWPIGCNELWAGTMDWVYHSISKKQCPAYKAVLTFESDCAPMQHGWIGRLSQEWDETKARENGALCALGAWLKYPGPHINGNGLFSAEPHHLKWLIDSVSRVGTRGGWDFVIYPGLAKRGAFDTTSIKSYWGTSTMTREWFEQEVRKDTVFIHGVKDDSLLDMARERLLGK